MGGISPYFDSCTVFFFKKNSKTRKQNKFNKNVSANILIKKLNKKSATSSKHFSPSNPTATKRKRRREGNAAPTLQVLVATGSVASVKVPEIAKALVDFAEVQKMKGTGQPSNYWIFIRCPWKSLNS